MSHNVRPIIRKDNKKSIEDTMDGIPLERITNRKEKEDVVDAFTCQICLGLIRNALIDRGNCDVASCSKCLEDYWSKIRIKQCPLKCKKPNFVPLNRIEKLNLKGVLINCQNRENGCDETPSYEELEKHEKNCQFEVGKPLPYDVLYKLILRKEKMPNEKETSKHTDHRKEFQSHNNDPFYHSLVQEKKQELQAQEEAILEVIEKANENSASEQEKYKALERKYKETEENLLIASLKIKEYERSLKNSKSSRSNQARPLHISQYQSNEEEKVAYPHEERKSQQIEWENEGDFSSLGCILTLRGHKNTIFSVIQLFDGRLASSCYDKTIKIWNMTTGALDKTLLDHTSHINGLIQLRDGRLASASSDSTVRIWNPSNFKPCESTLNNKSYAFTLAELNDGRLAVASSDHKIRIWNIRTRTVEQILQGHTNEVYSVVQLQDGRLVSSSKDSTLRIWNLSTGFDTVLSEYNASTWAITQLHDGRLITGAKDNSLKIWNVATQQCQKTIMVHKGPIRKILQVDGSHVLSASTDKTIKLINIDTEECVKTYKGHNGAVYGLTLLSEGGFASCSWDNTIKIWR